MEQVVWYLSRSAFRLALDGWAEEHVAQANVSGAVEGVGSEGRRLIWLEVAQLLVEKAVQS